MKLVFSGLLHFSNSIPIFISIRQVSLLFFSGEQAIRQRYPDVYRNLQKSEFGFISESKRKIYLFFYNLVKLAESLLSHTFVRFSFYWNSLSQIQTLAHEIRMKHSSNLNTKYLGKELLNKRVHFTSPFQFNLNVLFPPGI